MAAVSPERTRFIIQLFIIFSGLPTNADEVIIMIVNHVKFHNFTKNSKVFNVNNLEVDKT